MDEGIPRSYGRGRGTPSPLGFLGFFLGFSKGFLGFPTGFLGFSMVFLGFPTGFLGFSKVF